MTLQEDSFKHFLNTFLQNCADNLKNLHEQLLILESDPNKPESLAEMFRIYHTIKGNAAILGLEGIKRGAHACENLMALIKKGALKLNKDSVAFISDGAVLITRYIEMLKASGDVAQLDGEIDEFISRLELFVSSAASQEALVGSTVRATDVERFYCEDKDVSRIVFIIRDYLKKALANEVDTEFSQTFSQALCELEKVFDACGTKESAAWCQEMRSSFYMMVDDNARPAPFLISKLKELFDKVLLGLRREDVATAFDVTRQIELLERSDPTFRIEESKIDEVFAAVDKLTKVLPQLYSVRDKLFSAGFPEDARVEFQTAINSLNYLSGDIFQMLVKIKLVTPQHFLEKIAKLLSALAVAYNKKVAIDIHCKNILVERKNLELLDSIFIHVIRNTIDHGIELPGVRVKLGKSEVGKIDIELIEDARNLLVRVTDDGAGIDTGALKDAALKNGHISQEQYNALHDAEAMKLIFLPGISTRTQATEISGRGIGLDTVATIVNKAQGSMDVHSTQGKGTTIEIRIPNNFAFTA